MKKAFHYLLVLVITTVFLLGLISTVGCQHTKGTNFIDSVKNVIVGDDYYAAGKTVGKGSVIAYYALLGNDKYSDITGKCKELWKELDNQEGDFSIGTINKIAIEVCRKAVTDRYGFLAGTAAADALNVAGVVIDRNLAKKIDAVATSQFVSGYHDGVEEELKNIPADALTKPEKDDKKPFECTDGNCEVTITNRKVSHQIAVAQELLDGNYADKSETAPDGEVSKYDNITHFIERCKILQKYKVKKTDLYIKSFKIEGGVLKTISFKMILDDGKEFDVSCVGCMDIPEIVDAE